MTRKMHFVAFLMSGPTCHHHAMWRHPETVNNFLAPSYWEHIARTLEDGKFDALFLADTLTFYGDTVLERGGQMSTLDPLSLISIMSRVTDKIGLGATVSTSFHAPYALARSLQSLDVLSGGRVAWNIVTSFSDLEAQNYGQEKLLPRDERYARAQETVEACMELWNSWSDDALVMDKETGVFIDSTKIKKVDYRGSHVGTWGRFQVPPSPQRHPVLMQAGSSPRGRDFAAQWAELVFTLQHSLPDMQVFYKDMKARLSKFDRKPEDCAILASVDPIIGETEEIALAKQKWINDLVDPVLGMALVSAHTGVDLSAYSPDQPIEDIDVEAGSRGSFEVILQGTRAHGLSIGEAARRFATSELCPQLVGTPESVADQLQEMFESDGCDGFVITPTQMPGTFEAFTRSVVPILQKRGLFRDDYESTTLRGNIRSA